MEVVFWLIYNISIFVYRLPDSEASPSISSSSYFPWFMHGYIEAYTVALHYGWILGNGFHGVNTSSRKCLQLFMWAKIVFGTLFACESIGMIIKWLSHSSEYTNDGLSLPAAMIMWYILIQ